MIVQALLAFVGLALVVIALVVMRGTPLHQWLVGALGLALLLFLAFFSFDQLFEFNRVGFIIRWLAQKFRT
jgi:hypothetical protein